MRHLPGTLLSILPRLLKQEGFKGFFAFHDVASADGNVVTVLHDEAPKLRVDAADKAQIKAEADVRGKESLLFQLRNQGRELVMADYGAAVGQVDIDMPGFLFQIDDPGKHNLHFLAVAEDGQPGRAVPLHQGEGQSFLHVLSLVGLFDIFEYGQPVGFQSVLDAGGHKGNEHILIYLSDFGHGVHAGDAGHVNIQEKKVKLVGMVYFQKLLTALEKLTADRNWGLLQNGSQLVPVGFGILTDGYS